MKKNQSIFIAALLGGFVSIFGYQFVKETFFNDEKEVSAVKPVFQQAKLVNNLESYVAEKTDFTQAAEKTLNAVVHVKNTSIQTLRDPFAEYFYGRRGSGRKYEQVGTGSGVLISSDGYIITNNHVIDEATEIEVTLNNKKKYTAKLIGQDQNNDIALLKIDGEAFEYISFANSDAVKVGEWVLAVGNPYNLTSTVTAGIVSAKGRDLEGNANIESFIQTDAAVNPGNSGGALVNTRGELIGINTAISSKTGAFVGYSFAVPSNIAKKVIEDIMEYGNVQKALIGIQYDASKEDEPGVYIAEVTEGGGALKAGLKKGDVIVELNSVKIKNFSDLKGQLNAKRPGDEVLVVVERAGKKINKTVKLTAKKDLKINLLGVSVEALSAAEAKKNKLKKGVKISAIQNTELKDLGVKKGYVLLEINGEKVETVEQVENKLQNIDRYGYLKLGLLNFEGEKENFIFR